MCSWEHSIVGRALVAKTAIGAEKLRVAGVNEGAIAAVSLSWFEVVWEKGFVECALSRSKRWDSRCCGVDCCGWWCG